MAALGEFAVTLRSKNAGAFVLTIDIVLKSPELFSYVCECGRLTPETIAPLYGVAPEQVQVLPYPQVNSIKITLPRKIASGDVGDNDVYGAQQHVPIMLLDVGDPRL